MGFRLPNIIRKSSSNASDVPKGYLTVYVGDEQSKLRRFVIPVSFLSQPFFQELLSQAEEEFGFEHPMVGLTIPCPEGAFLGLVYRLNASS